MREGHWSKIRVVEGEERQSGRVELILKGWPLWL